MFFLVYSYIYEIPKFRPRHPPQIWLFPHWTLRFRGQKRGFSTRIFWSGWEIFPWIPCHFFDPWGVHNGKEILEKCEFCSNRTNFGVFWGVHKFRISGKFLADFGRFWDPRGSKKGQFLPNFLRKIGVKSWFWGVFSEISRKCPNLSKFGQNLTKFAKIGQNLTKFGQIWTNLDKFGQIWTNLGHFKSREISPKMG